jgi:hypothetical protein
MNILSYVEKLFYGLPTYDSAELIDAKKYTPQNINTSKSDYDLYSKEMDVHMFGAISPLSDEKDLLKSAEIEERARSIYKLCK